MVGIVLTVFAAVLAIRKCFCQLISTGKVFYRGQWSNFDQLATKENGSENRDKRKFPCAGVSLHRRFYSLRLKGYVCFSGSASHFGFLPSKPSFSLKCVTLNSCYTEANPQWIGSFPANQCDRWITSTMPWVFSVWVFWVWGLRFPETLFNSALYINQRLSPLRWINSKIMQNGFEIRV